MILRTVRIALFSIKKTKCISLIFLYFLSDRPMGSILFFFLVDHINPVNAA